MGADIHIYAERKLKDGTWAMCQSYESQSKKVFEQFESELDKVHHGLFYRVSSRNYSFFAALAGVRGEGPDPKGIPKDTSPLVREEFERWSSDAHSASHYTAREFVPIFMEYWMSGDEVSQAVDKRLEGDNLTRNILDSYLGVDVPYDDADSPNVDAIRFVFWFDN